LAARICKVGRRQQQTIAKHPIFITDSLRTLPTGDYASGTVSDLRSKIVAHATKLNSFYKLAAAWGLPAS
jgi:hypothetical protein